MLQAGYEPAQNFELNCAAMRSTTSGTTSHKVYEKIDSYLCQRDGKTCG